MSGLAITICRETQGSEGVGVLQMCVSINQSFQPPSNISSHLLYLLKPKKTFGPILMAGKMHHLKAIGSHTPPTHQATAMG